MNELAQIQFSGQKMSKKPKKTACNADLVSYDTKHEDRAV